MHALIVTVGSWGDVAPYTGLGVRLRAAGHRVTLATHAVFEQAVTAHGLGFRPLSVDPRAELASAAGQAVARTVSEPLAVARMARMAGRFMPLLTDSVAEAVRQGADVLLGATLTDPLCSVLGEALDLPSVGVYLQPIHPTGRFPPMVSGARSFGRHGNRWAGRLLLAATDRVFTASVARLCRELAVARRPFSGPLGLPRARTVLHGFSRHVLARPDDWPEGHRVCGYWWPAVDPGWRPDQRLVDFLAAGPPPVFAGFGSMVTTDAERLSRLVTDAMRKAGVRGIVQSGWSGLTAGNGAAGDGILTVSEVPHEWLFPRTAAVVHHAGAGTTAAGLRAGVPAVPVPVLLDQHFWAARLVSLGVTPGPVRYQRLTADRLAEAIRAATRQPEYGRRARHLAGLLTAEDGCLPVLGALESA